MDNEYKEVFFDRYCQTCKHESVKQEEEPCNECLDNPVNLYSHRPVKWESKERTRIDLKLMKRG